MNNNDNFNLSSNRLVFRNYKKIEFEITQLKSALKFKKEQLGWAIDRQAPMDVKGIDYSKDSFGEKKSIPTIEQILDIANIKNEIEELERSIKRLETIFEKMKDDFKEKAKELTDTELKVFVKRFIECKSYKEIANELIYTENYVRQIVCKINSY